MAGIEDEPVRSGEICLFEIFGEALDEDEPSTAVGMGIKPFRDPALAHDFEAPRLPLDTGDWHVYAADWTPGRVTFSVDGNSVRTVAQSPAYALQMMVAVFDFPAKDPAGEHVDHVPELTVDYVRSSASV
jgi:hypothetical protein